MGNYLADWQLIEDTVVLDLSKHLTDPKYGLAHAIDNGGDLYWHHNGQRRMFPNAHMVNALATIRDYAAMKEGGRITEIPPAAYLLNWDDAQPLPEKTYERFHGGDAPQS